MLNKEIQIASQKQKKLTSPAAIKHQLSEFTTSIPSHK
jgi:hypothetical protein